MTGLRLRDHHSNTGHGAYDPAHDRLCLQNQSSHKSQQSQHSHRHGPTGSRSRSPSVKQHTSITPATPIDTST